MCTANLCRSQLAEHLAAAAAGRMGIPLQVASAGTRAVAGSPIQPFTVAALARRGIHVAPDTVARLLDRPTIQGADLILVASARHRSRVAQLEPAAITRTFLLLQFAELMRASAINGVRSVVELRTVANEARGRVLPTRNSTFELADPMGGPPEAFDACATTLERAIDAILSPLAPLPRPQDGAGALGAALGQEL